MDQRSGDGRFSGLIKIIAINCRYGFPEFWTAERENCFCFDQDHPEFPLQEEGQSGRKRPRDKSDAPAETRANLPRMSISSKKRKSYILFAFRWVGFAGRVHNENLEEREFVVGFGASMHMVRRKDLNSAVLETGRISKSPSTVATANCEVLTKEATVYVRESDLFVTEMLLEDTPAVLSLGKLCEDHGENYHWTSAQKPHIIKHGRKIWSIDKFFDILQLLLHLHRRQS